MAANALKKITTRAKQLRKKSPGKSWKTVVKQAGAEYRAGKLKAKRKPAKKKVARKRKAVKRKTVRRRRVGAVSGVRRPVRRKRRKRSAKPKVVIRTRTRVKTVRIGSRRRAGIGKKSMMPLLLIGGGLLAAYLLLKPKSNTVYVPTGNTVRDSQAQQILAYAQAAGATAAAVAALLKQINASNNAGAALPDNSAVQSIISQNSTTGDISGTRLLQ